jgi:hypothetical protein
MSETSFDGQPTSRRSLVFNLAAEWFSAAGTSRKLTDGSGKTWKRRDLSASEAYSTADPGRQPQLHEGFVKPAFPLWGSRIRPYARSLVNYS